MTLAEWMRKHQELTSKPDHGTKGPRRLEKQDHKHVYECGCGDRFEFTDMQLATNPHAYAPVVLEYEQRKGACNRPHKDEGFKR